MCFCFVEITLPLSPEKHDHTSLRPKRPTMTYRCYKVGFSCVHTSSTSLLLYPISFFAVPYPLVRQAHLVRLAVEVEDMVLSRAEHVLARKRRRRRTHEKPFNRSTTQHQHQQLGQECDTPKATTRTNSSSVGGGGEGFRITPDGKRGEGALAEDVEKEEEEASDTEGSRSLSLERRLLATLVRPTGAQSSLVADELLLLRALRAAAAEHLGLDYVAKKTLFDDAVWDHGCGDDGEGDDQGLAQARFVLQRIVTYAK